MAELMAELREAVAKLTPAELEGAMRQLEAVMEALPPDVESGMDGHIRCRLEALTAGYGPPSGTRRLITSEVGRLVC